MTTITTAPSPVQQDDTTKNFYGKLPDTSRLGEAARMNLTDMGLGARVAIHGKGRFCFRVNGAGGDWYRYTGTHWELDDGEVEIQAFTRTVIGSIGSEEAEWAKDNDPIVAEKQSALDQATAIGLTPETVEKAKAELAKAEAAAAWARQAFSEKCENGESHIRTAVNAARKPLSVGDGQFDREPYLFNFQNGTLDLRVIGKRELLKHNPDHFITKVAAVDYKPDAKHEDLERILATLDKSGPGISGFIRRYLGSALTGLSTSKVFVYIKGAADAGKSTLFEAFAEALGDRNGSGYGRIISPAVFAVSKNDSGDKPSSTLHGMRGIRYIFMDEAERGFMSAEIVKKMSSGGTMATRDLYAKNVSWSAESKLLFAGNEWMGLPDNDPGIVRRLIACELTHQLTGDERDEHLQDRIKQKDALEAILAWAVEGAYEWLSEGSSKDALHMTEKMADASQNYLKQADPLDLWWEENVIEVDEGTDPRALEYVPLKTSEWHEEYTNWAKRHNVKSPLTLRHFGERLTARGFLPLRNPTEVRYTGNGQSRVIASGKFRQGIRHLGSTASNRWSLCNY